MLVPVETGGVPVAVHDIVVVPHPCDSVSIVMPLVIAVTVSGPVPVSINATGRKGVPTTMLWVPSNVIEMVGGAGSATVTDAEAEAD